MAALAAATLTLHLRLALVTGLVAAVVVTAGCSDGELARPDPATYRASANGVCANGNAKAEVLFRDEFPATPPGLLAFVGKLVPVFRATVEELRTLPMPAADTDALLDLFGTADAALSQLGQAATDPGQASGYLASNGESIFGPFQDQAAAIGLDACSGAGDGSVAQGGGGGAGPESIPNPAALPFEKLEFVEGADAVCASVDAALQPLQDQLTATFPPSLETWAAVLPQMVPVHQAEIDQLRALTPPPDDNVAVAALLDRQQALVVGLGEAAAAATSGDEDAFSARIRPVLRETDAVASEFRQYGFRVCGADA